MPKIDDYFQDTGVGVGSSRLKIDDEGQLYLEGSATAWDDVVASLIGRRLYSNTGIVDYNYTENSITFGDDGDITDVNDTVIWNQQYPHAAKTDGEMRLHIHWEQSATYASTPIQWTVRYRIQSNGEARTTAWTTVVVEANDTNNVFTYASGTINQITELTAVDMTDAGISATVQFQLTRSDGEGGTVNATFVDAHVEKDTLGSNEEYVK